MSAASRSKAKVKPKKAAKSKTSAKPKKAVAKRAPAKKAVAKKTTTKKPIKKAKAPAKAKVKQLAPEVVAPKPVAPKVETPPPVVQKPAPVEPPKAQPVVQKQVAPEPVSPKPQEPTPPPVEAAPPPPRQLKLKLPVTVKEFSTALSVSPSEVIKQLMNLKVIANINQSLEEKIAVEVAKQFSVELEVEKTLTLEEQLRKVEHEEEKPSDLQSRPTVVTLMGHVDHGKTSLLDAIRKSQVTEGEAGGITQHIGAYQVHLPKGWITFLDTPGHEAFTALRARGAHVTDVVILVIAADDGVKPQTIEAIDHAKAADATIVVALNKIDTPGAKVDQVKRQLSELELLPEDWGGKTVVVPVSAKTGEGIEHLLEIMLLESELLELKANPTKPARGIVIEAELTKGGGPVATVLVQNGTLRVGDTLVAGGFSGKVRAMINDQGHRVKEAPPSMPVEILGLSGVPSAGDPFMVAKDERTARTLAGQRQDELKLAGASSGRKGLTLETFHDELEAHHVKELRLVIKADVQGSVEALRASLEKLSTPKIQLRVLHAAVGAVNGPDVLLAMASQAVVIGFHVGLTPEGQQLSKKEQVDVRLYSIIYEAIDQVKSAMEGLLDPTTKETFVGRAKVLQVFKVSKAGVVAGCQVVKGKIVRSGVARVIRDGQKIYEGRISNLKRFKDDAREAQEGQECGLFLANYQDYKPDDIIEVVTLEQVAQKL